MKNLDKTLWIKRIFMVLMDICIVILTSITALIVRFEFSLSAVPKYYIGVVWSSLPATLVIAIIVFYVFRLYSSLWVYAGVTELLYLAAACIVDTLLNTVTILLNYRDQEYPLPRSWYFIYGTLGLSYVATVFLGKFFNLLFCTAVVTCAIRFSKYGKRTLMCVGLLPTTVFLFSSFTYDAFVIALLMLGIALFVTEYLSEEKIQTKRTMVSILAMVVGCFSKAVYIPFCTSLT